MNTGERDFEFDESLLVPPAPEPAPAVDEPREAPPPATRAVDAAEPLPTPAPDVDEYIALLVRDGLDAPIGGLQIAVTMPDGQRIEATTSAHAAIGIPAPKERQGIAKVAVKDIGGREQQVCAVDLAKCRDLVVVRSPKVAVPLPLRPHQQTPSPSHSAAASASASAAATSPPSQAPTASQGPWWSLTGALEKARHWLGVVSAEAAPVAVRSTPVVQRSLSPAGQPVTAIVGPECPNKEGLRLGYNNVYREHILQAAKRLGLIPQAICALIDCEAAKLVERIPVVGLDGKALKDKKGRPVIKLRRELWNPNSGNAESGAAGLTQFLAGTWLDHVMRPGFYIHEQSVAKGWVRQETMEKGKTRWVYVLSDGKTTTQPGAHRSDENVRKCLAMRMDPGWSINAAADYGNANLRLLSSLGFKLDGLGDMDKAKLMYLMHHEGEGAGPAFIRNTLGQLKGGTEGLKKKFAKQLGKDGEALSQELVERAGDDVEVAYRAWFASFVDPKFDRAASYFCRDPQVPADLTKLLEAIGGTKIKKP